MLLPRENFANSTEKKMLIPKQPSNAVEHPSLKRVVEKTAHKHPSQLLDAANGMRRSVMGNARVIWGRKFPKAPGTLAIITMV